MKARVTASETAREMCADENEDLVEKACLYLFDGRYPEGSTSNDKRVIRRKSATLTLRDGEAFQKKPKRIRLGKRYTLRALYGIHALTTSIKQEVFEVRYVRSSEERCRILKACHVDLTSRHMGVKRTFHRVLERFFFWKGVTKDIEIMVSVKKYLSFLITCICFLHRSLPVTSVKGIARNCPLQHQNCFPFQSIHPGIMWALILLALFHLRLPRDLTQCSQNG